MKDSIRAVVVDDNKLMAKFLGEICDELGVEVVGRAADDESALRLVRETRPDVLLLDIDLGCSRDGIDVANAVHEELPEVEVVFMTAAANPETMARLHRRAGCRVLSKPLDMAEFCAVFGIEAARPSDATPYL